MKSLKKFKKFAINNKVSSTVSGGNIPLPGGGGGQGGGGGTSSSWTYCCGGDTSSICGTQLHFVKVYCRTNGLPEAVRVN